MDSLQQEEDDNSFKSVTSLAQLDLGEDVYAQPTHTRIRILRADECLMAAKDYII